MKFGTRVKTLRQQMNMQQTELAEKLGMTKSSICRIESGERIVPVKRLAQFAYALNVPLSELVEDLDEYRAVPGYFLSPVQKHEEVNLGDVTLDSEMMELLSKLTQEEVDNVKQYVKYIINGRSKRN